MADRILVVDDDPNIREVIGYALEQSGHATLYAEDGLAALETARTAAPDLVVLDIVSNGIEPGPGIGIELGPT